MCEHESSALICSSLERWEQQKPFEENLYTILVSHLTHRNISIIPHASESPRVTITPSFLGSYHRHHHYISAADFYSARPFQSFCHAPSHPPLT